MGAGPARGRLFAGLAAYAAAFAALFASPHLMFVKWEDAYLWGTIALRLALIAGLLIGSAALFVVLVVRNERAGPLAKNLLASVFGLACLFYVLEAGFMLWPQSHGTGNLASRLWGVLYWKPVNSLGFRDREAAPQPGAYRILAVGDSFTEGYGIANAADRFGDLLEKRLGTGYRVYNLGRNGTDTREQFRILEQFPLEGDMVLLQYYSNDIEKVCAQVHEPFAGFEPYAGLGPLARFFVEGSFLLNAVYWQLPRSGLLPSDGMTLRYADYLASCYANEAVRAAHFRDIQRFIDHTRAKGIALLVVVVPFLEEHAGRVNSFVPLVEGFLADRGVAFVSVSALARDMPAKERVVSSSDGHASAALNARIAEGLVPAVLGVAGARPEARVDGVSRRWR